MISMTDTTEVSDPQSRRRAWALLSRVALSSPAMVTELVRAHGPIEAAGRIVGGVIDARYGHRDQQRAQDDLDRITALGGRLLTRDDPDWPARLNDLDGLGADVHAPVALWVRGGAGPDLFARNTIAVVGARAATRYGEHVAEHFAGVLARQGWIVISGGAIGIDLAAHVGALAQRAPTVAVLPCGLHRSYPAAHDRLLTQICESGLVVSEYPPGVEPAKPQFLARNRIVAALSLGVLVCESGPRGGTRNTVDWATRLARPVAAIPGPIDSAASAGCHTMIRSGHARLVTTLEQLHDTIPS